MNVPCSSKSRSPIILLIIFSCILGAYLSASIYQKRARHQILETDHSFIVGKIDPPPDFLPPWLPTPDWFHSKVPITKKQQQALGKCKKLTTISCDEQVMPWSFDIQRIAGLKSLDRLMLPNCEINGHEINWSSQFPHMETLSFQLNDGILDSLAEHETWCKSIRAFTYYGQDLGVSPERSLLLFKNLEIFSLSMYAGKKCNLAALPLSVKTLVISDSDVDLATIPSRHYDLVKLAGRTISGAQLQSLAGVEAYELRIGGEGVGASEAFMLLQKNKIRHIYIDSKSVKFNEFKRGFSNLPSAFRKVLFTAPQGTFTTEQLAQLRGLGVQIVYPRRIFLRY